ncbi:hypothetical protein NBRC10513v2_001984 [Rhodotorula toruloides]
MSEDKAEPKSQRTAAGGANLARQAIAALGGVDTSGSQNTVASGSGTQNGQASSSGAQGNAADSKGGKTPSCTTVLFARRTSFSTADEFFAECSKRLRAQYGYPANPSKRKDDKVTVRCFCHKLSGCPFRVCALKQQDGSWFVQNKACTWDHSHPASTTPLPPSIPKKPPVPSDPGVGDFGTSSFYKDAGPPRPSPSSALSQPSASAPPPPSNPQPASQARQGSDTPALSATQLHAKKPARQESPDPIGLLPAIDSPVSLPRPPPAAIAQPQPVAPAAGPSAMPPPSRPPSAASSKPTTDATSSASAPPQIRPFRDVFQQAFTQAIASVTGTKPSASPTVSSAAVTDTNPIPAPANLVPAPAAIFPAPLETPADIVTPPLSTMTAEQLAARTVVRFPPGTTFSDDADFFTRCAKLPCEKFGVATQVRYRTKTGIAAYCGRRQTESKCGYAVRAVPQATGWVLQSDKCSWTHTHESGTQTVTASGTQLGDHRLGALKQLSMGGGPADSPAPAGGSAQPKAIIDAPLDGVPSPTETFASMIELYCCLVVVYTKALGVSVNKMPSGPNNERGQIRCNRANVGCPFKVVVNVNAEGRSYIDHDSSDWRHNHGKHPNYAADPNWRPTVMNADARKALGSWLTPDAAAAATDGDAASAHGNGSASKGLKKQWKGNQWTKAREQKLVAEARASGLPPPAGLVYHFDDGRASPSAASSATAPAPSTVPAPASTAAPAPPPALSSAKRSPPARILVDEPQTKRPRVKEEEQSPVQPSAALPSPASTTADVPLAAQQSTSHSSRPTLTPLARSVTPYVPPAPRPFPELEPFLAALHPSIVPLAPYLPSFGFTSVASLVDLALLSETALDVIFQDLRKRIEEDLRRDPACRATVLQARLFVKAIKDSPMRAQE